MLNIKKANVTDLDRIMEIYGYAQDFMIRSGNPDQWGHSYPGRELILSDIQQGICHKICDENDIHGVFALLTEEDPTYRFIEGGEWLNNEPYVTIHRVASDGQVHGLLCFAASYCKSLSSNVRIDTYKDNLIMQRKIEENGFKKCGTIYLEDGSPRIAYHWAALQKTAH